MIELEFKDGISLDKTFLCGQCFRWEKKDGFYLGCVKDAAAKVYEIRENVVRIESTKEDKVFWSRYLNQEEDYSAARDFLSNDENMTAAAESGKGIRILRQDLWETIISFIISANNNIPRIKKIIESFCRNFGEKIEMGGEVFYSFPSPEKVEKLSLSDLSVIKAGFRDKYILDAAKKVACKEINLGAIENMETEAAGEALMKIKGIGKKVSDCVLLFSLGRGEIFPLDVWTKRIIFELYGVSDKEAPKFIAEKFGKYGGIAQQFLYYHYAIQKK